MDLRSGNLPGRRFEDVYQRVDRQVSAGQLDPADARWQMLSRTLKASHAHEQWVQRGAPRRRASDLSS